MQPIKIKLTYLLKDKTFIFSLVFLGLLLFLFAIYPSQNKFQQLVLTVSFFLIIPLIYTKIILKQPLNKLGIKLGNVKQGLLWAGIGTGCTLVILVLIKEFTNLLTRYPIPANIVHSFSAYLVFELLITTFFVGIYEFFFRGFIYLLFKDKLNKGVILFQVAIFLLMVLLISSDLAAFVPYLIFAPFAGVIFYKSESLLYSTVTQLVLIMLLDGYMISLVK